MITSKTLRRTAAAFALVGAFLASFGAHGQVSGKPVTLIVGTSPGGGGDNTARLLSVHLAKILGEPVIVENKTGADGVIAADFVAKSPPDGRTLLLATSGHMLRPFASKNLPYDTLKDLTGVTVVTQSPAMIVASGTLPFSNPREFAALLRANPNKYNYATPEIYGQFVTSLYNIREGIQAVRVPYRGSAQMLPDMAAGSIQYATTSISAAKPFLDSGRLKAVGIAGSKRLDAYPEVPTFREFGTDFEIYNRYGLFAPSKTSPAALEKLQRAVAEALKEPELVRTFVQRGEEPVGNTPQAFQKDLLKEYELFEKLARQAGIQPE